MEPSKGRLSRDQLIDDYQTYVRYVAGMVIKTLQLPAEQFDDFIAAGNLGLVEAAERFDSENGVSFKGFAFLRIRGAIIDSLRQSSSLSGRAYQFAKAWQAVQNFQDCDQDSSLREKSREQLPPEDKLIKILKYAAKGALVHRLCLSELSEEMLELDEWDPERLMIRNQEKTLFKEIVTSLPDKEREIVEEFYFAGKSFAEIAKENEGMSKSWVSRLHSRAMDRLRKKYIEAFA